MIYHNDKNKKYTALKYEEKISYLNRVLIKVRKDNEELTKDNNELAKDNHDLTNKNTKLFEENEKLREENIRLHGYIAQLTKSTQDFFDRYSINHISHNNWGVDYNAIFKNITSQLNDTIQRIDSAQEKMFNL